jgi:PAS domain S-box-containing protein
MVDSANIRSQLGDDWKATLLSGLVAALGFGLLAFLCVEVPRSLGQSSPIWLSNGFLTAILLTAPGRRWPVIFLGGLAGSWVAGWHAGYGPWSFLLIGGASVLQGLLAAYAVRRVVGDEIDLGRPRDMLAFILLAGFAAPLCTGPLTAGLYIWLVGPAPWADFAGWTLSDMLGMLSIAPALLVLMRAPTYLRERPLTRDGVLSILICCVVTIYVFTQSRYPLLFLAPPVMLLVAWRQEVLGAAISATLVAAISVSMTMAGLGPIHMIDAGPGPQSIMLQVFLVVATFVTLPVAALERHRRATLAMLLETREAAQRSEASFRLLAESALDIIAHSDLQGRMTYVSPAARTITGYAPEELLGRAYLDIVHRGDTLRLAEVVRVQRECPSLDQAPTAVTVEYRAYRKDGAMIWLESRPTLACDPVTGQPTGITDIIRDITARKTLEMDLRAARAEAEKAAAVKGEFLANMSHELRTPLTAVIGFANLLADEPDLSPRGRRYVDRIATGGRTLLATINDILDFSRLEQGRIALNPRPVKITDLVSEVLEMLGPDAAAKNLLLRSAGDEIAPPELYLDPERVRQVLLNLIGNAVKFTQVGEVRLDTEYDVEAGRLRVTVTDTGPGVTAEDQALIFARFAQIDAALTREHGGTGLGLAISRGLVELMGGEIGVESTMGQGARFWFEIPAETGPPHDEAPAPDEDGDIPLPPPGSRVLVVDDNPGNRELVRSVLEAVGVEVVEAVDGEAGVAAAAAAPYDAILMDLRMPKLDGVSAAQQIRAQDGPSARAAIIAFSADVRTAPLDPVFNGATPKPLTVASLLATLVHALGGPRAATT